MVAYMGTNQEQKSKSCLQILKPEIMKPTNSETNVKLYGTITVSSPRIRTVAAARLHWNR